MSPSCLCLENKELAEEKAFKSPVMILPNENHPWSCESQQRGSLAGDELLVDHNVVSVDGPLAGSSNKRLWLASCLLALQVLFKAPA